MLQNDVRAVTVRVPEELPHVERGRERLPRSVPERLVTQTRSLRLEVGHAPDVRRGRQRLDRLDADAGCAKRVDLGGVVRQQSHGPHTQPTKDPPRLGEVACVGR